MDAHRYLRIYLLLAIALLSGLAAFNAAVDPYGIYAWISRPGWNDYKAEAVKRERMYKAYRACRERPDAVVIGSSRALALSPEHPGWPDGPRRIYNLALRGGNVAEHRAFFEYAHGLEPQKVVVLTLPFYSYEAEEHRLAPEDARRLASLSNGPCLYGPDLPATLLSLDGLNASRRTLRDQEKAARKPSFLPDGMFSENEYRDDAERKGQWEMFRLIERYYLTRNYAPHPGPGPRYVDPRTGESTLGDLRAILDLAHRDGVDLRLVISPVHARLMEALFAAGLWQEFESWKRELVGQVQEAARDAEAEPFPLWDFTGYGPMQTEPVPPADDRGVRLERFWDPAHFRLETGNRVLDRVFGTASEPGGFGVLLTPANLEAELASQREAHDRWRAAHPEDVAEVHALLPGASG